MDDLTFAIELPLRTERAYYDLTPPSASWMRNVKSTIEPAGFDLIHSLGPTGLPIVSAMYLVYLGRKQKLHAERLLRSCGLGVIGRDDPMKLGRPFTLFLRPEADWRAEIPENGSPLDSPCHQAGSGRGRKRPPPAA